MELPKSRVNASMLPQFIDRPVCFVGRLEKVRRGSRRPGGGPDSQAHPEGFGGIGLLNRLPWEVYYPDVTALQIHFSRQC